MEEKPTRGAAGGGSKPRRCRYGTDCRKANCKFYHPPTTGEESNDDACIHVANKKSKDPTKNSDKPKKDRSKIQCRYGMQCRNTKCPFFHHPAVAGPVSTPTSPTRVSSPEDDKPSTNGVHTKGEIPNKSPPNFSDIVKKGIKEPETIEKAPEEIPVEQSQSSPESTSTTGKKNNIATPTRKATTKKKCRWGAGCRNKKCTFIHPGQKYEKDTGKSPKQKAKLDKDENGIVDNPQPQCTAVSEASPPQFTNNEVMEKVIPTKPTVVHPILPPSPVITEEPPSISALNSTFPASLLFPSAESHHVSSMPMDPGAHTAQSMFSNIFSSIPDNTTAGFSTMDETRERTPLYNKTSSSAFHSPPSMNGGHSGTGDGAFDNHPHFCEPIRDASNNDNLHDKPPDADWLFEVLGLNDDTTPSEQMQPAVENTVEETHTNNLKPMGHGNATATESVDVNHTLLDEQIEPTPISEMFPVNANDVPTNEASTCPSKKLVPEDEIVQSRRAALELRLEAQQNGNNPELLFTLLQTCRSKQEMIKTALERSMEGNGAEFDETNIVALLELNELLVGAIGMAESALKIAKINGVKSQVNGPKTVSPANPSQDQGTKGVKATKKLDESSWKSVDKKSTANKTAQKQQSKQTENVVKAKKSAKKSSQPFKSTINTTANVEHQKREEKPPEDPVESKPSIEKADPVESAQQEKERMARLLEEARKQSAAAREKKKSKKSKKFDRWLKQNEEEREKRAKSWSQRIAKENDYIDLIQKLLVAEFIRQSKNKAMGLTAERVLSDADAYEIITNECREAYDAIFGGLKCRIIVAGSENKDMNGRQGTLRYWDREKDKFCVGLDTKKSADSDVHFLLPEVLDYSTSARLNKTDKKSATSYDINIAVLMSYGGVSLGLCFTLQKSHVIALGSAESTRVGLQSFCKARDNEERRQKMEEEAEKKREEEDRKRRAARRAEENAAWERRKEQMRKDKEEYEEMKREWARERREKGRSMFDFDDDDEEECQCPRCRFGDRFSSSGGAFFFNIGGIPFRVRWDSYESDEESFDERWEEQLEEEKEQENIKQAAILGVDPDDDARTIKLAYRKMALKFHPDKWRSDNGMTRNEAENRFKAIQNAYDHLMSNFDD